MGTEADKATIERVMRENEYLMARVIESDLLLREALDRLNETIITLAAAGSIGLLNAEELAEQLKVGKGTIYQLARTNRIPVVRFSDDCLRFDPVAIRHWLNQEGWKAINAKGKDKGLHAVKE